MRKGLQADMLRCNNRTVAVSVALGFCLCRNLLE